MAVANGVNPDFAEVGIGGVTFSAGAGAPTHAAVKGSLYIRTDGSSVSTRVYVCSVATGTWVSLTASA